MILRYALMGITLCAGLCAAQVADFSGTWKLNVRKSSWGKKQRPSSITIDVEHKEPVLAYSGALVDMHGDGRQFDYKGVIDGKEYPISYQYGEGRIVLRRLDPNTVLSVFKSNDGTIVEEAKTRISRNGRVLTHSVYLKDPNGEMKWAEIYDKH